jgi:class I fructose-bisphosphate aldolase
MADAVAAGGRGAVIGRNVWGFKNVVGAVQAFKAVVHDGVAPAAAMKAAGLN